MSKSTINKLDKLNIYWQEKCVFKLKKTATMIVFGQGNIKADIVFLGRHL